MSSKQIRNEIILLLGNKCANPYNLKDCSTKDFIGGKLVPNRTYKFEIDHINGFGNRERKKCTNKTGNMNGYKYYKTILEKIKKGSKDYQLLCCTCRNFKVGLDSKAMMDFCEKICPCHRRVVTSMDCEKCNQKEECRYNRS